MHIFVHIHWFFCVLHAPCEVIICINVYLVTELLKLLILGNIVLLSRKSSVSRINKQPCCCSSFWV